MLRSANGAASNSKKTKCRCASVKFAAVGSAGANFTNAASSSAPYGSTTEFSSTKAQKASATQRHGPRRAIERRPPFPPTST